MIAAISICRATIPKRSHSSKQLTKARTASIHVSPEGHQIKTHPAVLERDVVLRFDKELHGRMTVDQGGDLPSYSGLPVATARLIPSSALAMSNNNRMFSKFEEDSNKIGS